MREQDRRPAHHRRLHRGTARRHLLAVSIGPDVDMTSIEQFLNELAADGVLQIQPGYIHQ